MQAVQQEMDHVKAEIQEAKQELAAAEQAGDGVKVDLLRKEVNSLRKKEGYSQATSICSDLFAASCALVFTSLCSMAAGKIAHVPTSI